MEAQAFDGVKMKMLRHRRFWTQTELAELADLSLTTIAHLERGETPSFATWKRVAEALGVEPSELVA